MKQSTIVLILLFLSSVFQVNAQTKGTPFIRNYPPDEYKAESQNWAIVQDQRGIMYFGNNSGLLEYDGNTWRKIEAPFVRSLAINDKGRIYVGLIGDFGFLQAREGGTLEYVSLKEKIPLENREFSDVWGIKIVNEKILFYTNSKLFVLQNNKINAFLPDKEFNKSFIIRNTIYVREVGKGILALNDTSLQFLPGSKILANERVAEMFPYKNNEILIVATSQIYMAKHSKEKNSNTFTISKPNGFELVDEYLSEHFAYKGKVLPNGQFALGTRTGGIIVFDSTGKITNCYNKQNGLQDNSVLYLYSDHNKQLWAGLNRGISLVQNNLPFKNYTKQNGLEGIIMCVQYNKKQLYVGTSQYLHFQNKTGNFISFQDRTGPCWDLYPKNDKLLVAANLGISEISDKQLIFLEHTKKEASYVFFPIKKQKEYMLVGAQVGMFLLEYKNNHWQLNHKIKGFDQSVYALTQDKEGNFWSSSFAHLYKLRLNQELDSVIYLQRYSSGQHNLPKGWAVPYKLNHGEIVFGTQKKGVYRYLSDKNQFEPHPDYAMIKGGVFPFIQDEKGNIWFDEWTEDGNYEKGVLRKLGDKIEVYKTPFYKFTDIDMPTISSLYPFSDSLVYFGTTKSLLAYYPKQEVNYDIPFNTLVRKVFVGDSLLCGGAEIDNNTTGTENFLDPKLEYKQNNLIFHYAATFYEESEKNMYSYRLVGMDTTWSNWSNKTEKEYTNLYEGAYRFEVKSKNIYRKIGKTATYSFTIKPPWHRTWLAYSVYGCLAILLIWIIVRINTQRLKKDKERLEQIVEERTAEIVKQKEDIEQQKEEIQTQSEELKSTNEKLIELDEFKQGMTGMIVHDLKNPLNGIINISKSFSVEKQNSRMKLIGRQILNMVLNILDVHKYEETKMIVDKLDHSLLELSQNAINKVDFLAEQKNLVVENNILPKIGIKADKEILERVFVNILTNAIKYTPNNGSIKLYGSQTPHGFIKISVSDTGQGIPQDQIHKVFDKFGQVEAKKSGTVRSTGLGLTFCKIAIEAHGGEIGVESELEVGTTFWFTLQSAEIEATENQQPDISSSQTLELSLTADDKKILEPFALQFKKHEIYDISILRNILKQIDPKENEHIHSWKEEMGIAIRIGNEERFRELINDTLKV